MNYNSVFFQSINIANKMMIYSTVCFGPKAFFSHIYTVYNCRIAMNLYSIMNYNVVIENSCTETLQAFEAWQAYMYLHNGHLRYIVYLHISDTRGTRFILSSVYELWQVLNECKRNNPLCSTESWWVGGATGSDVANLQS